MKRLSIFAAALVAIVMLASDAQAGRFRDRIRAAFGCPSPTCSTCPTASSAPTAVPATQPAVSVGQCPGGVCPPKSARGIIRR